ncbi:MAG: hypothetical protein ACOX52_13640 [Verrucomicrobiota bacterium]
MVENATAPSAGDFPGPDGEVRLRMRLPFRTGSSKATRLLPKVGLFEQTVWSTIRKTDLGDLEPFTSADVLPSGFPGEPPL